MKTFQVLCLFLNVCWIFAYCNFNGIEYSEGDVIEGVCFDLRCVGKLEWKTTSGINRCASCCVRNDPHFVTFDNYRYDWHGQCNYSISQPIERCPATYDPSYGIYGDFEPCSYNNQVTCLDITTYKVNEEVSVDIFHQPSLTIKVNNNQFAITNIPRTVVIGGSTVNSLIVWRDGSNGVNLQGPDFSMYIRTYELQIWTTRSHLNKIAGLCGFYTEKVKDDFLTRQCQQDPLTPNPFNFPQSWTTDEQTIKKCFLGEKESPCEDDGRFREICREKCLAEFQERISEEAFEILVEECAIDLCNNPEEIEFWCNITTQKAEDAVFIQERERIGAESESKELA